MCVKDLKLVLIYVPETCTILYSLDVLYETESKSSAQDFRNE